MKKTIKTLGLVGLIAGTVLSTGCGKAPVRTAENLTYQGYRVNSDSADYTLVFDDKRIEDRYDRPDLEVRSDKKPTLQLQKRYDVTYSDGRSKDSMISIKPSNLIN